MAAMVVYLYIEGSSASPLVELNLAAPGIPPLGAVGEATGIPQRIASRFSRFQALVGGTDTIGSWPGQQHSSIWIARS